MRRNQDWNCNQSPRSLKVKLAEALSLRADYQRRFEQLKQRLVRGAKVQEGDQPPEDPDGLILQLETLADDLTRLIQQINATNSTTPLGSDGTITDAIATRDMLKLRLAIYRDVAQAAAIVQTRTSRSEVKFVSTVNVADMQRRGDDIARQQRELDARIQEANWKTELLENR
jgi:hypothetical protein